MSFDIPNDVGVAIWISAYIRCRRESHREPEERCEGEGRLGEDPHVVAGSQLPTQAWGPRNEIGDAAVKPQ